MKEDHRNNWELVIKLVHESHILKLLQLRKEVPRNRLQTKRSHVQVE